MSPIVGVDLLGVRSRLCATGLGPIPIGHSIPPSVLWSPERSTLDCDISLPPDRRGTGLAWPPSAGLEQSPTLRVPLAFAWDRLRDLASASSPWNGSSPRPVSDPDSAAISVASVVAQAVAQSAIDLSESELIVVVPDDLSEEARQRILDAPPLRGANVRFLWRPVAAALQWIKHVTDQDGHATVPKGAGGLASIHLGLDSFEYAELDLVLDDDVLVPARSRPQHAVAQGRFTRGAPRELAGVRVLDQSVLESHRHTDASPPHNWLWHLIWCTPWAEIVLANTADCQSWPRPLGSWLPSEPLRDAHESITRSLLSPTAEPLSALYTSTSYLDRLPPKAAKPWRLQGPEALTGAIVTGDFAHVDIDGTPYGELVARGLGITGRIVVENRNSYPSGCLAEGAVRYGECRRRGEPTYFDTLPELEVLVSRSGEPHWQSLLQDHQGYVRGGEPFVPETPVTGFGIASGRDSLVLQVSHEEFPSVREVTRAVPAPAERVEPVELQVAIEPDRGQARVRVVPTNSDFLKGRTVRIDWKRAHDTGKSKEQLEAEFPRWFPKVEPRRSDWELWGASCGAIKALAALPLGDRSQSHWRRIAETLLVRNAAMAVGTDGQPPSHQDLYDRVIDLAFEQLPGRPEDRDPSDTVVRQIERVICHCKSSDPRVAEWIQDILCGGDRSWLSQTTRLQLVGYCTRSEELIGRALSILTDELDRRDGTGVSNLLRTSALLLMYREHASRSISFSTATRLADWAGHILSVEVSNQTLKMKFRYAALTLCYSLRVRAYHEHFLDADADPGVRIKRDIVEAMRAVRSGNVDMIGGSFTPVSILKLILDYIDKRGHGTLVALDH